MNIAITRLIIVVHLNGRMLQVSARYKERFLLGRRTCRAVIGTFLGLVRFGLITPAGFGRLFLVQFDWDLLIHTD